MPVNYFPWFYAYYQATRKYGGYFWDWLGSPKPTPEDWLGAWYLAVMNGCEAAEIKAGLNPNAIYGRSL